MAAGLELPARFAAAIAAAAEAAYPEEACGLLIGERRGEGWRVTAWHPAANVHAEPRRHFEVDPTAHFALLRRLREPAAGLSLLLGHVHSHPDGPAVPSARDGEMAFDPTLLWLIQAVDRGRAGALAGWRLESAGGPFLPLPLRISDL